MKIQRYEESRKLENTEKKEYNGVAVDNSNLRRGSGGRRRYSPHAAIAEASPIADRLSHISNPSAFAFHCTLRRFPAPW